MIEIISATRFNKDDFWNKSALGLSLKRISYDRRVKHSIFFENSLGLSDIYNDRITSNDSLERLVFIHDDVWIDDCFLVDRVYDGLQSFDLIGVAGNRRRVQFQPAWAFVDMKFTWDARENLSGAVAHGKYPFGRVSYFGPSPAECEVLDGVFLAAKKSVLISNRILFDPIFDFHLYDVDFCRSIRKQGLRVGTWPISITHQSGGAFGTEKWVEKYNSYISKWGA